jgi:hypothetical protein
MLVITAGPPAVVEICYECMADAHLKDTIALLPPTPAARARCAAARSARHMQLRNVEGP